VGGRFTRRRCRLPRGVKLAGLTHHLVDLGDMLLLEGDLFPGVFLKPHAPVHDEREQVIVLAKCSALVIQRFTQNLGNVVFMGLDQFADIIEYSINNGYSYNTTRRGACRSAKHEPDLFNALFSGGGAVRCNRQLRGPQEDVRPLVRDHSITRSARRSTAGGKVTP
jgi:hypothetical protein